MERFVFVAAITIAILFGIGAVFGGPNMSFNMHFDDDGVGVAPVVETAPGTMEAQTFTGGSLRIRHAAAIVTIITEDRSDFEIAIDNSAGRTPMPAVSEDGGRVLIDGQLRGRVSRCTDEGGANLRGYGEMTAADLPQITIRAPRSLEFDRGGAGTTEIGATTSLDMDLSGCSAAAIGDVAAELNLDVAGSGTVRGAATGGLNADVAGSGGVFLGAVSGDANIDMAGAGEVVLESLTGDLTADSAGSGSITVRGGSVGNANIDLAGSGDVTIGAPVRELEVSIVGSGDVDVAAAVGEIDAEIAGSGSVSAQSVSGNVRRQIWGSGDVRIGG